MFTGISQQWSEDSPPYAGVECTLKSALAVPKRQEVNPRNWGTLFGRPLEGFHVLLGV